jgi:thioesterase domain-containing protein/acyl carrier protein
VLGTHAGLAHFIAWQRQEFEIGPGDRCAQLTGLSFDVLLRDLFLPLTSGATLCLPEPWDLVSGGEVLLWLQREGISTLHAVPSLTRHWLASHTGTTELPRLRYLFLAGEPLRDDLVHWWRSTVRSVARVVNLYGPTETTLAKFYYVVPELPEPGLQPVGRPLPETQALVLTPAGTRCGPYEPGEIVIRTPFRTRGYLNSPEETAQRFRPNPHRSDEEDLLYHTGDRGYSRPDGALVVLGRLDAQLKVRGVRIEPGEIEAALLRHLEVREAAVDLRRLPGGEECLAAYIVGAGAGDSPLPDLRRYLLEQLPAALVPAAFVRVEGLPRSANGKLLRARLPNPEFREEGPRAAVPPRDEWEQRLAEIWQELLGHRAIGVHENFFDLGGHSLMAVQLLGRIHRAFGRELPLATLIQAATIAEIAERLRGASGPAANSVLVPIQPGGTRPPLFAVHGIGGGVLCYRALAELLGADQPFYALQAPALAGEAPTHLSLEEMATRYVRALRAVQPAGPYRVIGLSFGGNIALEMAQQLRRDGETVALLGMLDSKGPGYPRFPGKLARVWAHVRHFVQLPAPGRRHYLAVRARGARDLARRRFLRRWFQHVRHAEGALPRVLDDIGISHIQAGREYQRQPYAGSIILFQASHQPIGCIPEWDNGWSRIALAGVRVYPVPGEHAEIVEEPYVRVLAEQLALALQDAAAPVSPDNHPGFPVGC